MSIKSITQFFVIMDFDRQVSEIQKKGLWRRQGYSCQTQFNEAGLACQDFILPILHCNWNLKCHHRRREKHRAYKPGEFSQGEGNEP